MSKEEKNFEEFLQLVSKLEPVEYCGLCKILCVPLYDENNEPRAFDVTLKEAMDQFLVAPRKPRRQLMKVLRALGKKNKGDKNGISS